MKISWILPAERFELFPDCLNSVIPAVDYSGIKRIMRTTDDNVLEVLEVRYVNSDGLLLISMENDRYSRTSLACLSARASAKAPR
jgi:hypothetical protein